MRGVHVLGLANAAAEAAAASDLTSSRQVTTYYEFGISLAYSFQIFRPKLLNPKRRVEPIPGNAFPNVIDKVLIVPLVVASCLNLIQSYHQGLVSEAEARDLYNLCVSGGMATNSDDSFYGLSQILLRMSNLHSLIRPILRFLRLP
jgi:hypothetical protein